MKSDIAFLRQLNKSQSDRDYITLSQDPLETTSPKDDQLENENNRLKQTIVELQERLKSLQETSNQQTSEINMLKDQEAQQKIATSQQDKLSSLLQTIQTLTTDAEKAESAKNTALDDLENERAQRIALDQRLENEILEHKQTKQRLNIANLQLEDHNNSRNDHEARYQDTIEHFDKVEKSLVDLQNEKETLVCAVTAERKESQLLRALAKSTQDTAASLRIELDSLRREFKSVGKARQGAKALPALPSLESNVPEQGRSMILSIMWRKDRETIRQLEKALEESENALHHAKRGAARLEKESQQRITETTKINKWLQSSGQDKSKEKMYPKEQGWFSKGSSTQGPLRIATAACPSSKDFQAFYVQLKDGDLLGFKNKPLNSEKLERQLPDMIIPLA
ncbi:hypothetical protein CLU79DRAFT_216717 [Phycomyces nitens]|nr:hypothetical protein CLU79DRAFT_216717 [Phycomyces nitens]